MVRCAERSKDAVVRPRLELQDRMLYLYGGRGTCGVVELVLEYRIINRPTRRKV